MASPALNKQFDMLIASPSASSAVTDPETPLPTETTTTTPKAEAQKSPVLTCQKKPQQQQQHSLQERRAQSDKKAKALERQLHQTKLQTQAMVSKTKALKNTEAYVEDDESSEAYDEEEMDSDTDNEDSDEEEEDGDKSEDIGDESSGEERRRQRKTERRKQRDEEELEKVLKDPSRAVKRPRFHAPLQTREEIELLVNSMNQEALDRVIEQEAVLKTQRDVLTQKCDAVQRFVDLAQRRHQEYTDHAQWCQSIEVTIEQQLNRLEHKELELEKREQEVEVKWLAVKKSEETHLFVVDNEKERKCLDQLSKTLATRKEELDTLQKKCDERNASLEQRAKELDTKGAEIAKLEKEFEEKKQQQAASINALLPSNPATTAAAASSSRSTPTTTTASTATLNSHHPPHQHHHHGGSNNVLVKPEAALDAIIQEMQRTNTNQITQAEMQQTLPVGLQQNLAFCAIKHKLRSFSQSTGNHQILLVKDQETERVLIMQCIAKSVLNPSSK